ncbi:MAG: MATE family efflux transporter [Eubacteriales bacterium]|nr:MATE family efflux transporter [Eubacteriales bacterium]
MSYRFNKKQNTLNFPWKSFLTSLAGIAIPIAIQNLLTTTASMVDTMMVAPLGELSVGALGLCAQFSSLLFSSYWGFVGGGMLFFSQYYGSKEDDGIERSYGMTWACMMFVAAVFSCFAIFAPHLVMQVYTDKVAIQEIGIQYLKIVGFAYLMQVFSMAMSSLLRATDRVKIPMIASICSVASNLFLNWVFIYGNLGAPKMGIRGAALATTIAAAINLFTIYLLAWKSGYPYLFHVKGHFRWSRHHLVEYFHKCFPIICNELLVGIGNMVINITLGRQPEQVIAALAVFRTMEGLVIGFFAGFSNAASVLVGTCVGAGELETAYERAKRLVYLCSGVILCVNLLLFTLHSPILHRMSLSGESYRIGTHLLIIYGVASVIRMGNWIQNDTYRASGDAVHGTVLEIIFLYALVLPLVVLGGFVWKLPYWAIFIFCYIDEPVRYIEMQHHLYSGKWIRPVTDIGLKKLPAFQEKLRKKEKH